MLGLGLLCAELAAGWYSVALAQTPALPRTLPGAVEPGRIRPRPQVPSEPPFDFTIEQPGRSQVPRAVEELHFLLARHPRRRRDDHPAREAFVRSMPSSSASR